MFDIFDDIFDFNGDGEVDSMEGTVGLDILLDDDHEKTGQQGDKND